MPMHENYPLLSTSPTSGPTSGKRLAIVVGVNRPEQWDASSLKYAEDDARDIAHALKQFGRFELFHPPLTGRDATSGRIQDVVTDLIESRNKDSEYSSNDFLLFYFSGHGYPMFSSSELSQRDRVYLGTTDFDANKIKYNLQRHISSAWLRDTLFDWPQYIGQILIILDCCHAADINIPSDRYHVQKLYESITDIFKLQSGDIEERLEGARTTIAAARFGEEAVERDGHGIMTGLLLQALTAKVEHPEHLMASHHSDGFITLGRLCTYLEEQMEKEKGQTLSIYYNKANRENYVIAYHPHLTSKTRLNNQVHLAKARPKDFNPGGYENMYQPREGEFEELARWLLSSEIGNATTRCVGIVGLGGLGKTRLAYEFALHCKQQGHFLGGIFNNRRDLALGKSLDDWQAYFAKLAEVTEYLPTNERTATTDEEKKERRNRRARHICRYLAAHSDALLILNNVVEPHIAISAIDEIIGQAPKCAILYTARNQNPPENPYASIYLHRITRLDMKASQALLLQKRSAVISHPTELTAIEYICAYVEGHPLTLDLLSAHLRDERVKPSEIEQLIQERGRGIKEDDNAKLALVFNLSWNMLKSDSAKHILMLASYFPDMTSIPLWLLSIASNIKGGRNSLDPLGEAVEQLKQWSLIESYSDDMLLLHPLIRQFMQLYIQENKDLALPLRVQATERLISEFTNLNKLEMRIHREGNDGYWKCLSQVRTASMYATSLGRGEEITQVERALMGERELLGSEEIWPKRLPGIFYQQLYNRLVEDGLLYIRGLPPTQWIRLVKKVGIKDRSLLQVLRHSDRVINIAFSPDGTKLALTFYDLSIHTGNIEIWDTVSGRSRVGMTDVDVDTQNSSFSPVGIAFSSDGSKVITATVSGNIVMWNATNGKHLISFRLGQNVSQLTSFALSPKGDIVAIGSKRGIVYLCSIEEEGVQSALTFNKAQITSVAFSPDGTKVAAGSLDRHAYIWDIQNEELMTMLSGHEGSVTCIAFSPDGTQFVTGSDDKSIFVWDIASEKITAIFKDHSGSITCVAFSPDSSKLVTGSQDKSILIRDVKTSSIAAKLLDHTGYITSIVFSSDGTSLATAAEDGSARIWAAEQVIQSKPTLKHMDKITSIVFSDEGRIALTTSHDGSLRRWNTENRQPHTLLGNPLVESHDRILSVALHPNNTTVALGSLLGAVFLSAPNQSEAFVMSHRYDSRITCLAFSPNGMFLAIGSDQGFIYLQDIPLGQKNEVLRDHGNNVECLTFTANSTILIIGLSGGVFHLWDTVSSRIIATSKRYDSPIEHLCASPDASMIAMSTSDGSVYIWTIRGGTLLKQSYISNSIHSLVSMISFSPNNSLLAICYESGQVVLVRTERLAEGESSLYGLFDVISSIDAVYWQDAHHLIGASISASSNSPLFYHLTLEGDWYS